MALTGLNCQVSKGRNEVCKESVGGLAGVYFINYTTGSFTKNGDGEVTAIPSGSGPLYYYELKGTSAYTETVNTSRENGTTFFSQELTLNLSLLNLMTSFIILWIVALSIFVDIYVVPRPTKNLDIDESRPSPKSVSRADLF